MEIVRKIIILNSYTPVLIEIEECRNCYRCHGSLYGCIAILFTPFLIEFVTVLSFYSIWENVNVKRFK